MIGARVCLSEVRMLTPLCEIVGYLSFFEYIAFVYPIHFLDRA